MTPSSNPSYIITTMEHLSTIPSITTNQQGDVFRNGIFVGLWEPNLNDECGDSICLLVPSQYVNDLLP